jgi:hypothetical protein
MGPRVRPMTSPTFVGDVPLTNVAPYLHRCHVTNEYNLNSSVLTNTLGYVHQRYVRRCNSYIRRFKPRNELVLPVVHGVMAYTHFNLLTVL